MSASKPLSYEGLKTVLQHLEANKRFQVATCCRSLRNVEKTVPLKLNSLELGSLRIKVNGTSYTLGSVRVYPIGSDIPILHREETERGGARYDLDRFGAPKNTNERIMTPGDIFFAPRHLELDDDDYMIQLCLRDWKIYENIIKEHPHDLEKTESCRRHISRVESKLLPYLNRRDNVLPEYRIMVQLTIQLGCSIKFEKFEKTSKLHEAMKYLTTSMLGGHRRAIHVKHLSLELSVEVLRLPFGLKFKVRELTVMSYWVNDFAVLEPIIDTEDGPLEVLERNKPLKALSHPLEKTARKLIAHCYHGESDGLATAVSELENREVHLILYRFEVSSYVTICQQVLKNWIENGKEIGNRFSISVSKFPAVKACTMDQLLEVSKPFDETKTGPRSVKIPMNELSEIHVVYQDKPKTDEPVVSITVVPIGSKPL